MRVEHAVIDDLRSFVPGRNNTIYLRSSKQALDWFAGLDETVTIENLWLDHDLGEISVIGEPGTHASLVPDTTMPVVAYLLGQKEFKESEIQIDTTWIITMNNVMVPRLLSDAARFSNQIRAVNPVDYGLIAAKWESTN